MLVREWLVLILAVSADQGSKYAATQWLELWQPQSVLPGLNLTLAYNPGAAFSLLAQAPGWQVGFLVAVAMLVTGYIGYELRSPPASQPRWYRWGLVMVMAGACGNVIDRLLLGQVIDFIDLYVGHLHWPTFNLADTLISLGALMIVIAYGRCGDAS